MALLRYPAVLATVGRNVESAATRVLDAVDWWDSLGERASGILMERMMDRELEKRFLSVGVAHTEVVRLQIRLRERSLEVEADLEQAWRLVLLSLPPDTDEATRERLRTAFLELSRKIDRLTSAEIPTGDK